MFILERKNKYLSHLLRKFVVLAMRKTFPKYKYHSGSSPRRLPTQQMITIINALLQDKSKYALAINPHS